MSNRIDRSLGVKPYNNTPKHVASQPKGWSLKLTTVLKVMVVLVLAAGAYHVLSSTNNCSEGVRCAD